MPPKKCRFTVSDTSFTFWGSSLPHRIALLDHLFELRCPVRSLFDTSSIYFTPTFTGDTSRSRETFDHNHKGQEMLVAIQRFSNPELHYTSNKKRKNATISTVTKVMTPSAYVGEQDNDDDDETHATRTAAATASAATTEQSTMSTPDGMTPLSTDFQPGNLDVICGRGKAARNHEGNVAFRSYVETEIDRYSEATSKLEKTIIVSQIVQYIRSRSPHGGFVKQEHGQWCKYCFLFFLTFSCLVSCRFLLLNHSLVAIV